MDPNQPNNTWPPQPQQPSGPPPQPDGGPPPPQSFAPPSLPAQPPTVIQPQAPQPSYQGQPVPPQPTPFAPPSGPASSYQTWQQPASLSGAPSSGKKVALIIGIAVAVLLVLGGIGAFFLLKNHSNPISSVKNNLTGSKDVQDRTDGTLDLSKLIDKQTSIKAQDIQAKLNQQINLSDGLSYMVTKVDRNWQSASTYLKPDSGKEIVKITLVVGNRAKEGGRYVSSIDFKLENSAGGLLTSEYVTAEDEADTLISGDVSPGKQVKGAIFFTVDSGEKLGGLLTEDKYTNYDTNKEVTLKSKVALE